MIILYLVPATSWVSRGGESQVQVLSDSQTHGKQWTAEEQAVCTWQTEHRGRCPSAAEAKNPKVTSELHLQNAPQKE